MKEIKNYKLGVTGGIACGKSVCATMLEDWGWAVLDADKVAHDLMNPGTAVFSKIIEHFGVEILLPNGQIDRSQLGRIVFSDTEELAHLNSIVHPHVHEKWKAWLAQQQGLCAVVIPLLYETGCESEFDKVLCLASPPHVVIHRLLDRGLTEVEAKKRILAQMPIEEKMARADIPIANDGDLKELKKKLYTVHDQIENKEKQQNG